jgi:hypothetical protein
MSTATPMSVMPESPPRQQHLPQPDRQPAQVGIGDQPDLLAGQP